MPKEMSFSVNGKEELFKTVLDAETLEKVTSNTDKKRLSDSERLLRDFLQDYRLKALTVAKTIIPFERDVFIERFFQQSVSMDDVTKESVPDVLKTLLLCCEELKKENRYSTVYSYLGTYRSLIAYSRGELLSLKSQSLGRRKSEDMKKRDKEMTFPFTKITVDFLKKYESAMVQAGNSRGTVGKYTKILRAIYRKYYKQGMSFYPFGKDGYTIPSARKHKRALDATDIKKLLDYAPKNDNEYLAVGLWCTSYYCGGLNAADVIRLTVSDFIPDKEGGAVTEVIRQKTKGQREETKIEVVLSPKQWLYVSAYLTFFEQQFDRICSLSGAERFIKHKGLISRINLHLRKVSEQLGLPPITTYYARHSAATQLLRNSVPIAHISEMLGHKSIVTTQVYLGSFDIQQKREFAKKLEL